MNAQILPFPGGSEPSSLAFYVRIGTAHRKMADLFAAGRLPAKRVVVDASRVKFLADLLKGLREDGVEVTLDTEIAELSSPRKFPGHSRTSPWVKPEWRRPFEPQDFTEEGVARLVGRIATFCVENEVDRVLSPSHYIHDRRFDGWLEIDARLSLALRRALDEMGGREIAVDYQLILSSTELREVTVRGDIAARLLDLPFDNLWIRAAGMEGFSGPLKVTRFISSMDRLHNLGKPVVADYLGGWPGLALWHLVPSLACHTA